MKSGDVCHTESSFVLGKTARKAGGAETGLLIHKKEFNCCGPTVGKVLLVWGGRGVSASLPVVIFHVG